LVKLTFWPNQLNDLSKQDKMDKALEIFGLEKSSTHLQRANEKWEGYV
jgi:hypothetical protein